MISFILQEATKDEILSKNESYKKIMDLATSNGFEVEEIGNFMHGDNVEPSIVLNSNNFANKSLTTTIKYDKESKEFKATDIEIEDEISLSSLEDKIEILKDLANVLKKLNEIDVTTLPIVSVE